MQPSQRGIEACRVSRGLRVRGDTSLNLKDYDIGGLTKMLGMLKMHEEIVIHVDLMFGPS